MMNISLSVQIQAYFMRYGYIDKFHGCIAHKNGEHISVMCDSSSKSTIWLHIQISWIHYPQDWLTYLVSCNSSSNSAIWLHIQISWIHYSQEWRTHLLVLIQASLLPYGYIYKFHGCIAHKNGEPISVSCNLSRYIAIWLHIQISWLHFLQK